MPSHHGCTFYTPGETTTPGPASRDGPRVARSDMPDPTRPLHRDEVRRRLVDRRRALTERVTRVEDALGELDANRPPEDEEDAQEAQLGQPLVALDEASRAELAAIDAALARLTVGDYGICTRCGEPIETERLQALPTTTLCAECAADVAREARRSA
jgi:RNA polymerase-binding transcription factor